KPWHPAGPSAKPGGQLPGLEFGAPARITALKRSVLLPGSEWPGNLQGSHSDSRADSYSACVLSLSFEGFLQFQKILRKTRVERTSPGYDSENQPVWNP